MIIQAEESETNGRFFIQDEDTEVAEMTFSFSPGNIIIIHTQVHDKLRGKNVGLQLVHHAVEYARNRNLKIIPVCPFAKKVIEKRKKEWLDVL